MRGTWRVGVTYGRSLTDKFSAGIGVNYVQSTLASYSGSAVTFDFGTLYNTGYRSLRIGMAIQNIGSDMTFIEDTVKMPTVFRVGMSMNLYESGNQLLLMAGDFSHPPDNNERASWGMEYGFKEFFFLRSGYQFNYDLERFQRRARLQDRRDPELRGPDRLRLHGHGHHAGGAPRLGRLPVLSRPEDRYCRRGPGRGAAGALAFLRGRPPRLAW